MSFLISEKGSAPLDRLIEHSNGLKRSSELDSSSSCLEEGAVMFIKKLAHCMTFTLLGLTSTLYSHAAEPANNATATARLENARIDDIDKNSTSITVTDCNPKCEGALRRLTVDAVLGSVVKNFHLGDHATIDIDANALKSITIRTVRVDPKSCLSVLMVTAGGCFFLTALITWWRPLRLIVGQDGRYSNSKFQMAIWFGVLIVTYLATVFLRLSKAGWDFFGSVNIPQNLLLLSGLSGLTFGGAKGITTAKVNAAAAAGAADPKPAGQPNFCRDLIQNDVGAFDIGDFQMVVVTVLAVGMYLTLVFNLLGTIEFWKTASLPDVDTTILAAFGLGQGAYLTKKAVGNLQTS
jgi:hypothetical protein